jgi:hypothetical protein
MPEADANARDDRGQTKLMVAADAGDEAMVATLLAAGADVNRSSRKGTTAVIFAVWRSDHATLQLLVDAGADLTVRCCTPRTYGFPVTSSGLVGSSHKPSQPQPDPAVQRHQLNSARQPTVVCHHPLCFLRLT